MRAAAVVPWAVAFEQKQVVDAALTQPERRAETVDARADDDAVVRTHPTETTSQEKY